MSGTQMIFQLNHPIQLLNTTETIEITATFIASETNKYLYHSHITIIIKIESLETNNSSVIKQKYKIQQYHPISITPIAHKTHPIKNPHSHIELEQHKLHRYQIMHPTLQTRSDSILS